MENWNKGAGRKKKGQIFVDLVGAFLVLMLIAASGFAALEKEGKNRIEISDMCAGKNIVHSYADWLVKEGGTISKINADGSGYYLHHEMDLGGFEAPGKKFDVFISYADGKEIQVLRGAGGIDAGNYFCVKRIALCEKEICAVRVCSNDGF